PVGALRARYQRGSMNAVAEQERTIVIVEDDPNIADLLDMYLRDAGFRVLQGPTGGRGLELIEQHRPAMVVLDIGLPDIDGFEVCRRVRARSSVPVLFLTARDGEMDRIQGLELGADDYVTKPFSPREIVARVKAILRRGQPDERDRNDVVHVGDEYEVDTTRREVRKGAEAVALATREFDLLAHLARNQGIGFTVSDVTGITYDDMKGRIMSELRKVFRPEFLNRIDEVIVFHKLSREEVREIIELMLARVRNQVAEHELMLELDNGAKDFLADKGWDPSMGARPLRRAIQRYIEDPLADEVLKAGGGDSVAGSLVTVTRDESGDDDDKPLKLKITKPRKPRKKKEDGQEKVGVGAGSTDSPSSEPPAVKPDVADGPAAESAAD
ncbi:MAG TPA: response regulator, partial [Solirubrobacterales bacterium]|nr:response regulator [Solirubrobacterales bacterium]